VTGSQAAPSPLRLHMGTLLDAINSLEAFLSNERVFEDGLPLFPRVLFL